MSKAAPPSVEPTATVPPPTVMLLKLIVRSPESTVFVHSLVPVFRSTAAIWLHPALVFFAGILGWNRTAVRPSASTWPLASHTGPGSLSVHDLVPLAGS